MEWLEEATPKLQGTIIFVYIAAAVVVQHLPPLTNFSQEAAVRAG
jgi:hypothetical protein